MDKSNTLREMISRSFENFPDKIAVYEGRRECTFRDFAYRTRQMGNALLHLNLKKGDRVAVLNYNSMENAECYFSIPNAGLVLVMLNYRLSPFEILSVLSDAGISALIIHESFLDVWDQIKEQLSFVSHYILIGTAPLPKGWHAYEELIENAKPIEPEIDISQDDPAALMYTSGTTGKPKGCIVTHSNLYFVGTSFSEVMKMGSNDVSVVTTPLFHASGEVVLMNGIYSGTTTVIMPKWNVEEFMYLVEKHKVTSGALATPMLLYLLESVKQYGYDISSLKKILFAGAPISPEIFRKAINSFGNIFLHAFGTTETVGSISILHLEQTAEALKQGTTKILASCGKGYPGMEVQVVDSNDNPVPPGLTGEIRTRGAGVTKGYWEKPEETQKVFRNGWFYTEDLCKTDEQGFIYIVGRKKDIIITGAENVYPAEVESVLYQHPEISRAAVVGLDNEKWGEIVTAFIVRKDSSSLGKDEIISFCRNKIAGYKIPKEIYFMENLPISSTGKLLRGELKEMVMMNS